MKLVSDNRWPGTHGLVAEGLARRWLAADHRIRSQSTARFIRPTDTSDEARGEVCASVDECVSERRLVNFGAIADGSFK